MRRFTILLLGALVGLLLSGFPLHAQVPSPEVPVGDYVVVYIIHDQGFLAKKNLKAVFDTGGESIGGLTEAALNERFANTKSTVAVMNYVVQNGYRMINFSRNPGIIVSGTGGGSNGVTVLFERVK